MGVHNGIIENYQELKNKLLRHGHTFFLQPEAMRFAKVRGQLALGEALGPGDELDEA